MRQKNVSLGLLGVLGIWLAAGFALPFVNVLKMFTPGQLMMARGFGTAAIAWVGLRGILGQVDRYTQCIALVLPFATLSLFQGIRHWGAGPTLIIIAATPLVNLALSPFLGRRISKASIIGVVLVLGGVVMARWGGDFNAQGLWWSILGTILNAVLYELFDRATASPLQKCFLGSIGMGAMGMFVSWNDSWHAALNFTAIVWLGGFVIVGGFLYWVSNLLAFAKLPTNEASALAQGEAPAVIIGAYFLLGERITSFQWLGVAVTLCGACYLLIWLSKQARTKKGASAPFETASTQLAP